MQPPFFIEIINSTISAIYLAKNQLSSAKYYIFDKINSYFRLVKNNTIENKSILFIAFGLHRKLRTGR
jgi:hypothetical protein